MAEPEKISMWREVFRGFDRLIEALVEGIALPARLWRFLSQRFGTSTLGWAALGVIATAVGVTIVVSLYNLGFEFWREGGKDTSNSEVIRNVGLFAVGVFALGFGIWRSWTAHRQAQAANEQVRIAEQGQFTDRFTEAVKMLSDTNARTRVGAVYALARIAQDSVERYHIPIMEVLTEFIRNPPYESEVQSRAEARDLIEQQNSDADTPPAVPCSDIQAAIKVIATRNDQQREREQAANFKLSLARAALQELDLREAELSGMNLILADLRGADLIYADFRDADLSFADLRDADLKLACFIDADLRTVAFMSANLFGADLLGADLFDARNLAQNQIDNCRPSGPPINLPGGLIWPFVEKDGVWVDRPKE